MPLSASELHRRGVDAANARRFAAARRALATAADRTDAPDLLARIDGTLAYVLAQTGEPAAAEQLCRDALARPALHSGTTALLSGQLGTLLMHAGRLEEAETMLSRAIAALSATGAETAELANCLMNRSVVRMQRHELDACTSDLARAIAVYEALGDEGPLAEARHNLGYAALLRGDLVTALALMTSSRPTLAATSDLAAAISDLDRAEVLRDAGLTTEAEQLLAEVAARFGAQRMRQARAEAEFHLARSRLRHDPAAAERTAAAAARRFTDLGSAGWAARADAVRLEAGLRARPRARPPAEEVARIGRALDRNGFRTEATALRLTAGDPDRRMPRLTADAPTPLRLRAFEVRAARAVAAGRDRGALRAAAEGLELLTSWQRSFGALDLQASAGMHGSELVFTGLAAAARSEDPAVLFEWAERARRLSQHVAPVRPPHDEDLAADLAELRMLRADLSGSDWTTDTRVRALRDRVRQRQWSATSGGEALKVVGLAEARAHLEEATAILAYVFTGERLLCVAVTAADAHIVDLSWARVRGALEGLRADLDVAALTRGGPMAALVERSLDERLCRLDDELLAPVRAAAGGARRWAITAPGALAGIPWAMLPGMAGTPFTLATSVSRWVSDRQARPSSFLPSARGGARPNPHAPSRPTPAGAESRGPGRDLWVSAAPRVGFAAGPRVPRALEEARTAASAWASATILADEDARVAAVTELASSTDVLHVAAHGRHALDNPLFSGLELADGTLFGYDVDLVPRTPDTVVLSACELGRSAVRWGEEALGMTRVWLHAGTRCVIATPVIVADDVACELLGAVHAELAAGAAPAVALAAASGSTGHRAPFQCHGSGF